MYRDWLCIHVQPIPFGMSFSKAQSSKLQRLFCHVSMKRDVRALSFELSKMSPQVSLAVLKAMYLQSAICNRLCIQSHYTHNTPSVIGCYVSRCHPICNRLCIQSHYTHNYYYIHTQNIFANFYNWREL